MPPRPAPRRKQKPRSGPDRSASWWCTTTRAVEFARNGFAALLSIGRQPPDVLITDIVMPHLDGPAMLASLKQNRSL